MGVSNETSGSGRVHCHGPFKCQECGETRDKKEFSRRQLELPKHNIMVCRHCNEAEKFAAKEERRNALELSKQLKEPKNEISNRQ